MTRLPLPAQRISETSSFSYDNQKFFVTVGYYENGHPGEIFVITSTVGSALRTAFESWARLASKALQRQVPFDVVVSSIRGTREGKPQPIQCKGEELHNQEALSAWDALAQVLETLS